MKLRLFIIFIIISIIIFISSFKDETNLMNIPYCGYPLISEAQDYQSFYNQSLRLSKQNIVIFDSILTSLDLTPRDRLLMSKFINFPPYITRRSSSNYLCNVLNDGSVTSNGANTPPIEKSLYNADQCVFMSIGSPLGQPIWGDVLITFDSNKLSNIWSTPRSGWHYVATYRIGNRFALFMYPDFGGIALNPEREFMRKFIFTPTEWQNYLIDVFMGSYKAQSIESQNEIGNNLLSINNRYDFQTAVMKYNLGYYLEAHANKIIPLTTATYIQITESAARMAQTRCKPAYERWKDKIIVKDINK